MFGVNAIPLSTQNTLHDGETPIPERAKASSRRNGTYFARVTPARSVIEPATSPTPCARRSSTS
jgi:hypothetical protein